MDSTAQGSPTAAGPDLRPVPDIAAALGVIVTKVHQLLRDRAIVGVRRDGVLLIPSEFVSGGDVVQGLTGTITVLTDAGFDDGEIIDWLFAAEADTTAMAELAAGRVKGVHRRAQISGF